MVVSLSSAAMMWVWEFCSDLYCGDKWWHVTLMKGTVVVRSGQQRRSRYWIMEIDLGFWSKRQSRERGADCGGDDCSFSRSSLLFGCEAVSNQNTQQALALPEKEVIQPHLPVRLPCYDFTPVTSPAFGIPLLAVKVTTSGMASSHSVTGGVYKARERIHRRMADRQLLAIPASCRRVAACNPN
ncbi:hypothetical protein E3N88_12293 [Mikania micrantha]|uniref:Uncharacterized protein n=1 Tax=Mikania micrantha TaxID=192012 RepID=A0A5N6P537_9ASTR|nr:hypothetical protein E3N88_12293 [Mikania micrantha]